MSLPPYDWLNVECPTDEVMTSGWSKILLDLLIEIDGLLSGSAGRLRVAQMKEKFGSLRFYHRLTDASSAQEAAVRKAVQQAGDLSRRTCFKCGAPGERRWLNGWLVPTCDLHADRSAFR